MSRVDDLRTVLMRRRGALAAALRPGLRAGSVNWCPTRENERFSPDGGGTGAGWPIANPFLFVSGPIFVGLVSNRTSRAVRPEQPQSWMPAA